MSTNSLNSTMHKRFAAWVDGQVAQGLLPMGDMMVSHRGRIVMRHHCAGLGKPNSSGEEMIYRIYSMTKPIVSLAIMMLYEEGRFQLTDPVWQFLGSKWMKQNMKVIDVDASEKAKTLVTVPCKKSVTVYHLLTHTSGLSHGLIIPGYENPLDEFYASVGLVSTATLLGTKSNKSRSEINSLKDLVDKLGDCPLLFQPGTHWHYSYSVDLLARIVEVISGEPLDKFLQKRIFEPLGMKDTHFYLPESKKHRLSEMWLPTPAKTPLTAFGDRMRDIPYTSGSGGLFSTTPDYMLFAEMLLRGGRCNQGKRVVSQKTIEWMTENRLPGLCGKISMRDAGLRHYSHDQVPGIGFGLGFAVIADTAVDHMIGSKGCFFWGGAASTHFWIDPSEDLAVVFSTQLLLADPRRFPTLPPIRAIVYGSLDYEDASASSADLCSAGRSCKCGKSKL